MSWLQVKGNNNPELEKQLESDVQALRALGRFSENEQKWIKAVDFKPVKSNLELSNESLENLRRLCQIWDVDLRSNNFSSHRKFFGPLIVTVKKLIFPVLRFFLKDFIRQQRQFNAACIAAIADSLNQTGNKSK